MYCPILWVFYRACLEMFSWDVRHSLWNARLDLQGVVGLR